MSGRRAQNFRFISFAWFHNFLTGLLSGVLGAAMSLGGAAAHGPAPSASVVGPSSVPAPARAPRSLEDRCADAVAAEVARLAPATGFTISCGPSEAGGYNSGIDGWTTWTTRGLGTKRRLVGVHHIHPDDADSDEMMRIIVRHEIGHGYCLWQGDESEACAYAHE